MTKARIFFEENFINALKTIGIDNPNGREFMIILTEEKENYTNWDNIYRFGSTPIFKGIRLNYLEVSNALVKENKNVIPLWIKIYYNQDLPVILEISQRFRTVKEILNRSQNNPIAPFEIGDNLQVERIVENERMEAIRILLFRRIADERLKGIIGEVIYLSEIKQVLEDHLKHYRFYPLNQNSHSYSSITINQDYKTGIFSICKSDNLDYAIKTDLNSTKAIEYFVENQIKNELFGIKIKH